MILIKVGDMIRGPHHRSHDDRTRTITGIDSSGLIRYSIHPRIYGFPSAGQISSATFEHAGWCIDVGYPDVIKYPEGI